MDKAIAALLLSAALLTAPAFGQADPVVKRGTKAARAKAALQRARKQQVDRLSAMSPDERERTLSQLPPARRLELERRLERYKNMTPAERERALRQAAAMTPAQRQAIREQARRMAALPEERRPIVRREVARLRRMTPDERKARLGSDEIKGQFQPEEQKLLEDISETLPPDPVKNIPEE